MSVASRGLHMAYHQRGTPWHGDACQPPCWLGAAWHAIVLVSATISANSSRECIESFSTGLKGAIWTRAVWPGYEKWLAFNKGTPGVTVWALQGQSVIASNR